MDRVEYSLGSNSARTIWNGEAARLLLDMYDMGSNYYIKINHFYNKNYFRLQLVFCTLIRQVISVQSHGCTITGIKFDLFVIGYLYLEFHWLFNDFALFPTVFQTNHFMYYFCMCEHCTEHLWPWCIIWYF